jgi:hypothetical protein
MTVTKNGWWKVNFDITLFEGEEHEKTEVRFEDLSDITQERIINSIKEGFTRGEIIEDEDDGELCE